MAIARALVMSPDYVLFDEVTSALDPLLVGEVLDMMRMLSSEGMTMIVVTHEITFARDVSDRVAVFYKGKIHEIGPPTSVIGHPQKEETRNFLNSVVQIGLNRRAGHSRYSGASQRCVRRSGHG